MSWTANNKYFLTGSITSGLTLSINNTDAGTVPTDMSLTTYNDGTYNDYDYELTAIYEGTFESSFSTNDVNWSSVGDANDIKYQYAMSDDGITFSEYTAESDAIGTTNIAIKAPYFKLRFIFYSSNWTDTDSMQVTSITRAFTQFVNGGLIDANEWMSNYYVCGQEDLLPKGGNSMALTTSVYNLGSSAHQWNNIYIDELNSVTTLAGTLSLKSRVILSATSNRIEISGLGTTSDTTYYLQCKFLHQTASVDNILLFFNSDSATNYGTGYKTIQDTNGAGFVDYTRDYTASGIYIGQFETIASNVCTSEGIIYVNPSYEKQAVFDGITGISGNTTTVFFTSVGVYNSKTTVTSIQIYCASEFDVKTEVSLWTSS